MSLFLIQIINIMADFLRMAVSIPFAKYSAKYGFLRGLQLSSVLTGLAYLTITMTTPKTWYLIILYTFLVICAAAGNYQNSFNVYYVLVPQKYMTQAMAFRRTFIGTITFLSAILGGKILDMIQLNNNMIFGIHIYAQQFLALLALPLWALGFYLNYKCVIKPIEKRKEENYE
jgi:MFS family permease